MRNVDSLFASTQSAALHTSAASRCTVKSEPGGGGEGLLYLQTNTS